MTARPIALLAHWPELTAGQTAQEAAVEAAHSNLNLRRWIRAAFGEDPVVEVLLREEIDRMPIGCLEQFGALVILRRGRHSVPGEEKLLARWSECGPARPIVLRPQLPREPVQKRKRR